MSTDRSSFGPCRAGGSEGAAGRVRVVAWVVGGAAFAFALPSVIHIIVWRTRWQPGLDALRWYHKNVDSRRVLKSAGKRHQSAAVVRHTGRRSGRVYRTPVWAHRVGESFFIGLPYGTDVDWLRNVRAAGGCGIEHDGVLYRVVAPVVLPIEEAPAGLDRTVRMLRRMGVRSLLRLDIAPSTSQALGPDQLPEPERVDDVRANTHAHSHTDSLKEET